MVMQTEGASDGRARVAVMVSLTGWGHGRATGVGRLRCALGWAHVTGQPLASLPELPIHSKPLEVTGVIHAEGGTQKSLSVQ